MKKILVLFFSFFTTVSLSQNLVLNGDFENFDSCPNLVGSVNGYLIDVYNPYVESTSDFFSNCDIEPDPCIDFGHVGVPLNSLGYQSAFSGNSYVGMYFFTESYDDYREYVLLKLSEILIKDSVYSISFRVSKAETSGKGTDAIMIGFVDDSIPLITSGYGVLNIEGFKMTDYPIVDNKNWTLLSKNYKANGGEKYLVIGNFLNDYETLLVESDFEPFMCTPTSWVGIIDDSYYFVDNVELLKTSQINVLFPNVITPNGDHKNDYFNCIFTGVTLNKISILNRWGQIVFESSELNFQWDGKFQNEICDDGIYFYIATMEIDNEIVIKQGNLTLIK